MKDVIATLQGKRAELLDSVARIDAAISALGGESGRSSPSARPARRRRNMSAEARKATSERMKNYWAERRKQSAAAESNPATEAATGASDQ